MTLQPLPKKNISKSRIGASRHYSRVHPDRVTGWSVLVDRRSRRSLGGSVRWL